jgi:hypothetical protein
MIESPLTEVVHSPLSELLRHRRGTRSRTALVFGDGSTWRLVGPGADARAAGVRLRDVARGRFRSIYRVRLGERLAAFDLNLAAADSGAIVEASIQLSWWVSDPVAAAASRVIDGAPLVRLAVGRCLADVVRSHSAAEVAAAEQRADLELAAVTHIPGAGLSYGYGHATFTVPEGGRAQLAELDRLRRELDVEDARLQLERRRILFYGELLRAGREAVLAYWLAHSPQDIAQVYDRLPAEPLSDAGALLPGRLVAELDDFERSQLREEIGAALVAMGREDLAKTLSKEDQPRAVDRAADRAVDRASHGG